MLREAFSWVQQLKALPVEFGAPVAGRGCCGIVQGRNCEELTALVALDGAADISGVVGAVDTGDTVATSRTWRAPEGKETAFDGSNSGAHRGDKRKGKDASDRLSEGTSGLNRGWLNTTMRGLFPTEAQVAPTLSRCLSETPRPEGTAPR